MPVPYPGTIADHRANIASIQKRSVQLTRAITDALAKAGSHTDPNLSSEGLAVRREELATEFRAAARNDLEQLQKDLRISTGVLREAAERERPRIANDPAELIRTEQKWRQVETQLNAGIELRDVLASADLSTALAIEEFGPAWAAARSHRPAGLEGAFAQAVEGTRGASSSEIAAQQIRDEAYANIANLATGDAGAAMRAVLEVDATTRASEPWLTAAADLVEGRDVDMLGVAITAAMTAASPAASDASNAA